MRIQRCSVFSAPWSVPKARSAQEESVGFRTDTGRRHIVPHRQISEQDPPYKSSHECHRKILLCSFYSHKLCPPHKQILIHIHLSDFVFLNLPARIYLVLQLSHAQSDKNLSSNLFENFFSYLQYFASYARIEAMVLESSISP